MSFLIRSLRVFPSILFKNLISMLASLLCCLCDVVHDPHAYASFGFAIFCTTSVFTSACISFLVKSVGFILLVVYQLLRFSSPKFPSLLTWLPIICICLLVPSSVRLPITIVLVYPLLIYMYFFFSCSSNMSMFFCSCCSVSPNMIISSPRIYFLFPSNFTKVFEAIYLLYHIFLCSSFF